LLPILSWLLQEHRVLCPIQAEWADLRLLPNPPKGLAAKIKQSLDLYPCDLLFVHRDAENRPYDQRKAEINEAIALTRPAHNIFVCVAPVRMLEAWLLIDEAALRRAAGNPNGRSLLELPDPARLERCSDPKSLLHQLLRGASELKGRRLQNLRVGHCVRQVSDYIDDFSPLRNLPAFQYLESDIEEIVVGNRWAETL
jgi:hypothetical protein